MGGNNMAFAPAIMKEMWQGTVCHVLIATEPGGWVHEGFMKLFYIFVCVEVFLKRKIF